MSVAAEDILFRPLTVKSLALKNRIVMAPMTRGLAPDGMPAVLFHGERALEGVNE
ncbi:MAG TPA: hypothetical protein VF463_20955 [Sphingobium sp.]